MTETWVQERWLNMHQVWARTRPALTTATEGRQTRGA
jgi:hypothetical protein